MFFRWWATQDDGTASPADVLTGIRRHTPPPRPTPEDILHDAIAAATPRTQLILRLAAELGLRRSEIATLHRRHLTESPDGWTLTVHGKGGRTRVLPVTASLAPTIRHAGDASIFPGQIDGHLSPRWVSKLAAQVLPPGWSLHTLRHRFATTAYRHGGHDLLGVQQVLCPGRLRTLPTGPSPHPAITTVRQKEGRPSL
ncbi:site-specific integrase [Corynebacterium sp. HMSC11E11]|uniref:tyrosine-type recombinase/integrase n=1 Tax=Corynebacterium sp. HMSC11E11 TaxID=1581089 RepID=UPI0014394FE3